MPFADVEDKSQDQIDAVINQLAGNNSSLAACSFVSKHWRAKCLQQDFRRASVADLDGLQYSDLCRSSGGTCDSLTLASVFLPGSTRRLRLVAGRTGHLNDTPSLRPPQAFQSNNFPNPRSYLFHAP